MCMSACEYRYLRSPAGDQIPSLALELQVLVSQLVWLLGAERGSSAHQAVPPATQAQHFRLKATFSEPIAAAAVRKLLL